MGPRAPPFDALMAIACHVLRAIAEKPIGSFGESTRIDQRADFSPLDLDSERCGTIAQDDLRRLAQRLVEGQHERHNSRREREGFDRKRARQRQSVVDVDVIIDAEVVDGVALHAARARSVLAAQAPRRRGEPA